MIRPFYRSRLFWLGIPGLLFLLWAWWDSGGYRSAATAYSPSSSLEGVKVDIHTGEVSLEIKWRNDTSAGVRRVPDFTFWRVDMPEDGYPDDPFASSPSVRRRQFDFPTSFRLFKDYGPLGKDPHADGWVPSPGATLPKPQLRGIYLDLAYWLLVLVYLTVWGAMLGLWQRRKARLMRASSATPLP